MDDPASDLTTLAPTRKKPHQCFCMASRSPNVECKVATSPTVDINEGVPEDKHGKIEQAVNWISADLGLESLESLCNGELLHEAGDCPEETTASLDSVSSISSAAVEEAVLVPLPVDLFSGSEGEEWDDDTESENLITADWEDWTEQESNWINHPSIGTDQKAAKPQKRHFRLFH